jgi:hypothetical protein
MKMSNFRISTRIALATVFPLLAFTVFGVENLYERSQTVSEAGKISRYLSVLPSTSAAVHNLQRERGASVGFVNSG